MRLGSAAVAVLGWMALIAPSALAARAEVELGGCNRYSCGAHTLLYRAGSGETNSVTVSIEGENLVLRDSGASIDPGRGCSATTVQEVRCVTPGFLTVILGDQDDRLSAAALEPGTGSFVFVDGGPGADQLVGGPLHDLLAGGPGRDALNGGEGADGLAGDAVFGKVGKGFGPPGFQGLAGGGVPSADLLEGGDGEFSDRALYSERRSPVRVDLSGASRSAGGPGEEDTLVGIEGAVGGSGDDVLTGAPGRDFFEGGPGDDLIAGRGGDDLLFGDGGDDLLRGGPGDDELHPYEETVQSFTGTEAGANRFECGPGAHDLVEGVRRDDLVDGDCERVQPYGLSYSFQPLFPLLSLRSSAIALFCTFTPCNARMELRVAGAGRRWRTGRRIARRAFVLSRRTGRRCVGLRLSPAGRRLLRRRGRLRVLLRLVAPGPERGGFRFVLADPRRSAGVTADGASHNQIQPPRCL